MFIHPKFHTSLILHLVTQKQLGFWTYPGTLEVILLLEYLVRQLERLLVLAIVHSICKQAADHSQLVATHCHSQNLWSQLERLSGLHVRRQYPSSHSPYSGLSFLSVFSASFCLPAIAQKQPRGSSLYACA